MSAARKKDLQRNADLATIHVGIKKLGIDDPTYREMWSNQTHGRIISARDATADERHAFIENMRRLGFKPLPKAAEAQDRMARALWLDCVKSGALRDRSERAFRKLVKRATGVDRLEWMTAEDANKVIEMFKQIKRRKEDAEAEEEGGAHR